jgi:hypothetical protein
MNTKFLVTSPIDHAQAVDADMLALGSSFFEFRTETDFQILKSLECSVDEHGDDNLDYWDNLNL